MTIEWQVELGSVQTAIQAAPTELAKQSKQAASRNAGTINQKARENFEAGILRPQESGHRPEWRQTGNFEFGSRFASGTFRGAVLKGKNGAIGFGYPDIAHADAKTEGVWRALEWGLKGKYHTPSSLLGLESLAPDRPHRLPKRYIFGNEEGAENRGTGRGQVLLTGRQYPLRKDQRGGGIEAKNFIENAWIQSLVIMRERYITATKDALRIAFGRG